jgi:hypothetical protein
VPPCVVVNKSPLSWLFLCLLSTRPDWKQSSKVRSTFLSTLEGRGSSIGASIFSTIHLVNITYAFLDIVEMSVFGLHLAMLFHNGGCCLLEQVHVGIHIYDGLF